MNLDSITADTLRSQDPLPWGYGVAPPLISLDDIANFAFAFETPTPLGDMPPVLSQPPRRPTGACKRCKRLKMKCEFEGESGPCRRCAQTESTCEVEPRMPTSQQASRHNLIVQLREREKLLAELLQHMNMPVSPTLDDSHDRRSPARGIKTEPEAHHLSENLSELSGKPDGPSRLPDPRINQRQTSPAALDHDVEIIASGIILPAEVDGLFHLFFESVNPCINLLDPSIHTPRYTISTSRLLFTAICAIAARHFSYADPSRQSRRAALYRAAMNCAHREAASAFIAGPKCVEMVQGFILLALFAPLPQSWADDRTAIFKGLALRVANELELHRCVNVDRNARNTWLVALALDGSTATLPHGVDVNLAVLAEVELVRIVGRFREVIKANFKADSCDEIALVRVFEEALSVFEEELRTRLPAKRPADECEPYCVARLDVLSLYARLAMHLHCLHCARTLDESRMALSDTLLSVVRNIWNLAVSITQATVQRMGASNSLSFAPASHLVPAVHSALVLLKLMQCRAIVPAIKSDAARAMQSINHLAHALRTASQDEQHPAGLYAAVLRDGLTQHVDASAIGIGDVFVPRTPRTISIALDTLGFGFELDSRDTAGGVVCWCR